MLPAYAELHCLSNFSFLRGASHPEELVERAHALGYGAIAITDECSVAGVVRAHLAAKEIGQKLLIGSELTLLDGLTLVLLATDRDSYGDLSQLITRGRRAAVKGHYALTRDDVGSLASRCLALWMPADPLAMSDEDATRDTARWLAEVFAGHAWIGVELFAQAGDVSRLARLEALGRDTGLPLVAAGDVHMHARARRALQDTLTAIRLATPLTQCGYALHGNGERHLRSRGRLATIYPRALTDATLDVAQRCEFSLDALRYEYPREIVPEGETPASWLRKLTEHGLAQRYGPSPQPSPPLRVEREHSSVSGSTIEAPSPREGAEDLKQPQPSVPSPPLRLERESSSASSGTIEAPSPRLLRGEGWGEGAFADKGRMLRGDRTFRCATAPPEVRELIEHELGLIAELAYEPYFLTVQDIVAFARSQDILCQGRG